MVLFNKPVREGLGTNTNLVSPNAPFQSLDRTPNAVLGEGQMNMSEPPKGNSNDRRYQPKSKANQKNSGRRSGRKEFRKTPTMINNSNKKPNKGYPLIVPPFGNDSNPTTTTTQRSDFSYDITGQPAATPFDGVRDDTLFKDWNRTQLKPKVDPKWSTNGVTSYTKILTCDFKSSLTDPTYATEWAITYSNLIRDVIRNTNASKGAFDVVTEGNIGDYIHEVSRLFTYLYELEVMMGWNPQDHSDTNAAIRHLAEQLAVEDSFLTYRTKMKEVLRSHVLPMPMLKYLRWLREYKRTNEMPESPKLSFRTQASVDLMESRYRGVPASTWAQTIDASITAVRALDARIPALLLDKVNCIDFVMVKDYWGNACNRAHYDSEFNNIYNNRLWARGTYGSASLFPDVSDTALVALNTIRPQGLALCNLSTQIDKSFADMPLENVGGPKPYSTFTSSVGFVHFYVANSTSVNLPYDLNPVKGWFEHGDDSTFTVDDASTVKGIAIPRGDTLQMFYPGKSNINMAKRLAFQELFQSM